MTDVIVVGGGHNGLVCGCYLARAGLEVVLLEQAGKLGGGSRTDELVPGYRFDTHSVAHNMINMTDIPQELRLAEAGLTYQEMDPFSVAVFADGPIVRFHRSIERTVESIREVSPADAERYAAWMADALPLVRLAVTGLDSGAGRARQTRMLPTKLAAAAATMARYGGPRRLAEALLVPYGRLLRSRLTSDRVRAPVSAFAAHASASPNTPGSAFYALWQAAYHSYGQWHAVGGSQALVDALTRRYASWGGRWRTSATVAAIRRDGDRVLGVRLADGEQIAASRVVTGLDPRAALLELLDPPLSGPVAEDLRGTHHGNAVQMLVHLAVRQLPAYPRGRSGDWNGLQSYVDSLDALAAGFARAEAGELPQDPVPTYAFTPSALDDTLAPPGQHTVYLACPTAPFSLRGGWSGQDEAFADRMVETVCARVPGFRASIVGRSVRSPAVMATELRWPGAHPMQLDVSLDQLAWMRPTRALAGHTTPVRGLFVSGAGTAPVGGVSGAPGRAAAKAVLRGRGAP